MVPPRPTHLAQTILQGSIQVGDTVIDATAGHGHDTVFLAECVGANGRVMAFDVQENAIRSACEKVAAAGMQQRVSFHQISHTRMAEHAAPDSVSAVMFNLGYLPGGDHTLTTVVPDTIAALARAADLLKSGGVLSIVCYPGHPEGMSEAGAVESWLNQLSTRGWRAAKYELLGTLRAAPYLIVTRKP